MYLSLGQRQRLIELGVAKKNPTIHKRAYICTGHMAYLRRRQEGGIGVVPPEGMQKSLEGRHREGQQASHAAGHHNGPLAKQRR